MSSEVVFSAMFVLPAALGVPFQPTGASSNTWLKGGSVFPREDSTHVLCDISAARQSCWCE